jgi:hypothetical protein
VGLPAALRAASASPQRPRTGPTAGSSTPLPTLDASKNRRRTDEQEIDCSDRVDRPRSFRMTRPRSTSQSQVDPETQRGNTEVQRRHQRPERINRGRHNGRRELSLDRTLGWPVRLLYTGLDAMTVGVHRPAGAAVPAAS